MKRKTGSYVAVKELLNKVMRNFLYEMLKVCQLTEDAGLRCIEFIYEFYIMQISCQDAQKMENGLFCGFAGLKNKLPSRPSMIQAE